MYTIRRGNGDRLKVGYETQLPAGSVTLKKKPDASAVPNI